MASNKNEKSINSLFSNALHFIMEHRIKTQDLAKQTKLQTSWDSHDDPEQDLRHLWQIYLTSKPQASIEERRDELDHMQKTLMTLSKQQFSELDQEINQLAEKKKKAAQFIDRERYQLRIKEFSEYHSEELAKNEWQHFLHDHPRSSAKEKMSHLDQILETTRYLTQERLALLDQNHKQFKPEDVLELSRALSLRQEAVMSFIKEEKNKLAREPKKRSGYAPR